MKKLSLLLFLALASCGGQAEPQETPQDYFDALEVGALKALEADNLGIRLDQGKVQASFENHKDDGSTSALSLNVNPLVFEAHVGGLHAQKIDEVTASLRGYTKNAPNGSKISLKGDDLPSTSILDNVKLAVHGYFDRAEIETDEGKVTRNCLLLDLYNSGVVRNAINALIKDNVDSTYSGIPSRCYIDINEENANKINESMPLDTHFKDAVKDIKAELLKIHEASSKDFTFAKVEQKRTIAFQTTSWSSFRNIVESFDFSEIEASMEFSSVNMSSLFDGLEADATLKRFKIGMTYDASGIENIEFSASFSFKEGLEGEFVPTGEWNLSGSLAVYTGEEAKPYTLSEKEKAVYKKLTFPKVEDEGEEA